MVATKVHKILCLTAWSFYRYPRANADTDTANSRQPILVLFREVVVLARQ